MVRLGQPKSKTEFSVFFFGFFFLAFHALAAEDPASQPSKPLGCDPERVLHGPGADTDLDVVDGRRYYQWHRMLAVLDLLFSLC